MNHMKELGNEEKKEFGRIINEFKTEVTNSFEKGRSIQQLIDAKIVSEELFTILIL